MDFGCYYKHYVSDMTRTIHVGQVTDEEREIYDIVLRSNQAPIESAKLVLAGLILTGFRARLLTMLATVPTLTMGLPRYRPGYT